MKTNRFGQLGVPAAIVGIVAMMVIPLPAAVLDLLLVVNLAAGVMILLATMFVQKALDFSVFPSLLLVATLFRLALNVSSVRLVLLHGYAGQVIESFGHVVIGGSVVVGLVIFLILVVIQFIVITNGAGRVAEVGARFTLDAMPGKQMAIDADLNSGMITEDVARKRRREVSAEADFYGAMDGASKFVKGDAIAAIIITVINLFGGFIVGVVQHGMNISEAMQKYSLLTVGDGLVSQIPALLISISSGLIVTRAATENDLGSDVLSQLGRQAIPLKIGAACMGAMMLIPGLPKLPFLVVAGLLWYLSTRVTANDEAAATEAADAATAAAGPAQRDTPQELVSEMRVEPISLEIGYGLMDLVDTARGGDLLDRVRALRRKVAMDLGIVVPPLRTRDNVALATNAYAIKVHGVVVANGEAPPGVVLVLGPCPDGIPATKTVDPVFGMDAAWVPIEFGQQADMLGATVIDRASVLTAHLAEVIRAHASRLISRQDVKLLVDGVKATDPIVAEELSGAGMSLAEVQRVLQNLLDEGVPVRDLVRILEVLSERGRTTKDPETLVEAVRSALGPAISSGLSTDGKLPVITLDPLLERTLFESLRTADGGSFLAVDGQTLELLITRVAAIVRDIERLGVAPVLLCPAPLRPALRRMLRATSPTLPVLSYSEVGSQLQVESMGVVNVGQYAAV